MLVPIYYFDFWPIFVSFLVLETALGVFNSCAGTLRSQYYPEAMQSSIMSVFRLPLNLLVVVGTRLSANASTDVNVSLLDISADKYFNMIVLLFNFTDVIYRL